MKANLFIIGAAKSGSTSLAHYLGQHPDIHLSPIKEPNHFSREIKLEKLSPHYKKHNFLDTDSYFSKDKLEEIQLSIVQNPDQYARLFETGKNAKYRAEASVSYMYSPVAGREIYNYNPNARIIAILRHPAERAFSHYLMALRYGYTSLPFREAFEKDKQTEPKGWGITELFYELGLYHQQLQRYYDLFPAKNICVLLFEDLARHPDAVIRKCFDFLDIPYHPVNSSGIQNAGEVPKNPGLNKILYRSGLTKAASALLPKKIVSRAKSGLLKKEKPVLSDADKNYLKHLYAGEIKRTAELTGVDLNHWL